MRVLVCAATRAELAACERGIARAGLTRTELAAIATLRTGVGPRHAEQALAERLAHAPLPALVVSSGFAGAIAESLAVGSWVTASSLAAFDKTLDEPVPIAVTLRRGPSPAVACVIVSTDILGNEVDARADAVDMESAALASVAARHGVAFMVLRLISDTRARSLPSFLAPFAAAMAADGARSKLAHTVRGVRSALADPSGVVRIIRDGSALSHDLASGWTGFARAILYAAG